MMRNIAVVLIMLYHVLISFGQEQEDLFFLETNSTWRKEIFQFPLGFAPDIPYEGIEDARFPEGWEDSTSTNFWSYAFAWNIAGTKEIPESELEHNLKMYFDGLMGTQHTMTLMVKREAGYSATKYVGKVLTYDAFFTKKQLVLNVLIDKFSYDNKTKSVILLRFSPKEFKHDVWHMLEEVKLPANFCDQ
jgi:hypothetical protein